MISLIAKLLHLPAIDAPLDARAALTEGHYLVREDDVKAAAVQLRDAWDKERQRTLAYEDAIQTVLHFLRPTDGGMRQLERERIEHAGDLVGYLRRVLDEQRKEGK